MPKFSDMYDNNKFGITGYLSTRGTQVRSTYVTVTKFSSLTTAAVYNSIRRVFFKKSDIICQIAG